VSVIVRGLSECERNLNRARLEAGAANIRTLRGAATYVQRAIKLRMGKRGPSHPFWGRTSPGEGLLGQRTGKTSDRVTVGMLVSSGNRAFIPVGSPDKYVKNAEEGGAFTTSGFFRIPTAAAQTPSGVDRLMGQSIKGRPGFRLIRTKAGKLWGIHENYTKGGFFKSMTLMYLFVKRITLKGHHVFLGAKKDAEPKIAGKFVLEVQSVVRVGNG